jgi:hypothetical protein
MKKLAAVPLFALAVVLVSPPAHADAARAGEAFQRGAEAYGKSDFTGAARHFEKAYQEEPRGAAMYNAGLAWEAAADAPRAADAYALAMTRGDLSGVQATDAQNRLKALGRNLGKAEITGPAGVTISVAHAEARTLPATVHLAPGTYPVRVTYTDNTSAVKQITVNAGASAQLTIERPAPAQIAPPPIVAQPTPRPAPAPEPAPERDHGGGTPTMRYVGFSAMGVGAVLAGVGIITGLKALDARDEFNATGQTSRDAHDRADSLRTTTNVLFIAGGVVGLTGLVLVLTSPSSKPSEPQASVGVGPANVSLRVRF